MEIQIPLVLFTTFLSWSLGIFGTQCILALRKQGGPIQLISLIVSVVVLGIGGIAVLFHLEHPLRIFNGFGHLTSGITQELIAIAVLVVVMLLFFLMLRRSEDNCVPVWLAIVGLVACALLVVSMGHSYMMSSRPAWNSVLQLLSLLGAACVLGPATVAVIASIRKVEIKGMGLMTVVGAAINAVLTLAYLVYMQIAGGTLESFDYYYDPTHPLYALVSGSDMSLFSSDCLAATIVVALGLVVSLACAIVGKTRKSANWKIWGGAIIVGGLACAIALRAAMYVLGETLFMLY